MPGLMMAPTPSLAVCVAAFPGQKIPKSELTAEFLTQLQSKEGWMASPGPCRVSLAVVWVVVMAVVQFR